MKIILVDSFRLFCVVGGLNTKNQVRVKACMPDGARIKYLDEEYKKLA